jgi:hypothetical protein
MFGAICPKHRKGAAPVMPRWDTEAMNLHLADIAIQITPGTHAALPVDQADWHLSGRLIVPPNITLIPLPPKRSEPAGKHLAAHAQTGSPTGSSNPRRHRRPLLRRMEQARRSTLAGSCPRPVFDGGQVNLKSARLFWKVEVA